MKFIYGAASSWAIGEGIILLVTLYMFKRAAKIKKIQQEPVCLKLAESISEAD